MKPVWITGVAQLPSTLRPTHEEEAELVFAATEAALNDADLPRSEVGFVCSGSSDYTVGRPFSFVMALDGVGAWPPIRESHVEMDGAWALYEAWVRLQHGDIDTAMVYAYGRSTAGSIDDVYNAQLDPYTIAPMRPGPLALAALQARCLLDRGLATEADFAQAVANARAAAAHNPNLPPLEALSLQALLNAPYVASPLRAHDAARRTDGAAAVVLSTRRPAKGVQIHGIAHLIEVHALGARDLVESNTTRGAAQRAGLGAGVDVAELHTPYSSQELILRRALNLGPQVVVNPSGGALAAETPFVAGLIRIIEATHAVRRGATRALAHATAGPCLQHNLVTVLEAT